MLVTFNFHLIKKTNLNLVDTLFLDNPSVYRVSQIEQQTKLIIFYSIFGIYVKFQAYLM